MSRRRSQFSGMRRSSGVDIGKIAVKVYRCLDCSLPCRPGADKPDQCVGCGSMRFTKFDSTGELSRYATLELLQKAGEISDLERQVRFPLMAFDAAKGLPVKVGEYVADYVYMRDGKQVVEDFKGAITDLAQWKLRHMAAQGMPVKITT